VAVSDSPICRGGESAAAPGPSLIDWGQTKQISRPGNVPPLRSSLILRISPIQPKVEFNYEKSPRVGRRRDFTFFTLRNKCSLPTGGPPAPGA